MRISDWSSDVCSSDLDLGVMISASHNPYQDNGIKLFGPDGYKLSDEDEAQIEHLLTVEPKLADAAHIGRAKRIDDARGRYIHAVKHSLPESVRLDGLRIVLDCANGRAYNSAPSVFWELGADVVATGVRSEEHTSELQSLLRHSSAVFCLQK